ncbi:GL13943 [Drosophila persimilis]|uniref:GL13943 n=1 Tax=Drosophila persimilis TaxID=7234 RepID=B4GN47_DROPE|nr:GL13943 [Drosophila persimilis]
MTCDTTAALVAHMCDVVQFYMLPELKEDLDNVQLAPSQFESYHVLLANELPKFYDLVQEFLQKTNNAGHEELRAQIVMLLCELTAAPTVYQLNDGSGNLLRNANKLGRKLSDTWGESMDAHILKNYEKKLQKNCWKRQLGAVHGFARYLEVLRYTKDDKMTTQMLAFSLSVGLNVRECYDFVYKQLGVQIFSIMLKHGDLKDIQELNIHSVIYDHALRSLIIDLDAFTFITRLGYYFTINRGEIEAALATDLTRADQLDACQEVCSSINSSTSYRWAKSILQMLVLESEKLLQGPEVCAELLGQMQRCYLVCILPIPLQALHVHLPEFYTKFVAVLLECMVTHKMAPTVQKLVQRFTEIFSFQLKNCSLHQLPSDLEEYVKALKSLQQTISK